MFADSCSWGIQGRLLDLLLDLRERIRYNARVGISCRLALGDEAKGIED